MLCACVCVCREVLDKLLDDNEIPLLCDPAHHMTTPTTGCTSVAEDEGEGLEVFLGAPSAYGIKTDQERVTYLNRGESCDPSRCGLVHEVSHVT